MTWHYLASSEVFRRIRSLYKWTRKYNIFMGEMMRLLADTTFTLQTFWKKHDNISDHPWDLHSTLCWQHSNISEPKPASRCWFFTNYIKQPWTLQPNCQYVMTVTFYFAIINFLFIGPSILRIIDICCHNHWVYYKALDSYALCIFGHKKI